LGDKITIEQLLANLFDLLEERGQMHALSVAGNLPADPENSQR
jgi:hypothetical protein